MRTPAVSPDGRVVVFQVWREGAWLIDLGTGALRRIRDDATEEESPGRPRPAVAYRSRASGRWSIQVIGPGWELYDNGVGPLT